jgi:DNA damage-inducible protein 1
MPQSQDADRDMLSLDVGPTITIGDLKAVIAADTNIAANLQVLFHNGDPLADSSQTLEALRITDGDMLVMQARRVQEGVARARARPQARRVRDDAEILRLQALGEPRIMNQLRLNYPALANAVQDQRQFREIREQMIHRQQEAEEEKQRMMDSMAADPFDMEAQKKIEELIRENAVMHNITEAMEHTPEGNLGPFPNVPLGVCLPY